MEKLVRDALAGHIDALSVELKIAKVTIPGLRDTVSIARLTAFTASVQRIYGLSQQLVKAAGLNGATEPLMLDLDDSTKKPEEVEG